jgi:Thioredoxin domain
MVTPAVVVDGQMKVSGQVPSKAEVKAWLKAGK